MATINTTNAGDFTVNANTKAVDNFVITTFYKFFKLKNPEQMKMVLLDFCNKNNILGTILIGSEGLNSTISGSREAIDNFYEFVKTIEEIKDLTFKESFYHIKPFQKMKVKIKKEIVTIGLPVSDDVGEYVKPEDWDALICSEDVVLIDTRNDYEYFVGTFEGAVNPDIKNFRQFPQWIKDNLTEADKKKKIATFCTGGIRCEKATAFMKDIGFEKVYHLEGGILAYFEKTKNKNKKWKGNCFVFDERMIVDDTLKAE